MIAKARRLALNICVNYPPFRPDTQLGCLTRMRTLNNGSRVLIASRASSRKITTVESHNSIIGKIFSMIMVYRARRCFAELADSADKLALLMRLPSWSSRSNGAPTMSLAEISGRYPTDVLNARVTLACVSKQISIAICETGRLDDLRSLLLIGGCRPSGRFDAVLLDLDGPSITDQSNGSAGENST